MCPIKGAWPIEREALCLCDGWLRGEHYSLIGLIKCAGVTAHSGMVILKAIGVITHLS